VVAALLFATSGLAIAGPSVTVEGTAFRVTLPDGRVLSQDDLPGTVLTLGDGSGVQRRIRIEAVQRDDRDPTGEVTLYTLSEPDLLTGEWRNACDPDPDGRRLGFPLAGAFTPDGRYVAVPGRLLVTCTGGAEGKCIRFGYKPWHTLSDGTSLEPYYRACVRLVRADYGGDGVGHTRNGTPIDLFDRIGIQRDETAPDMTFESAFDAEGAVCVAHTRLPDVLSMRDLLLRYPRLAGDPSVRCNEATPALLYVRSAPR
jgi:ADYC domain